MKWIRFSRSLPEARAQPGAIAGGRGAASPQSAPLAKVEQGGNQPAAAISTNSHPAATAGNERTSTQRVTSGDELKQRSGLGGSAPDLRGMQARYHRTVAAAVLL